MLSAGLALLLFSLLRVTGLEADSLPTAIVVGILSVLWSLNRSRPWKIRDRDIAA